MLCEPFDSETSDRHRLLAHLGLLRIFLAALPNLGLQDKLCFHCDRIMREALGYLLLYRLDRSPVFTPIPRHDIRVREDHIVELDQGWIVGLAREQVATILKLQGLISVATGGAITYRVQPLGQA
jgi:hypothetical protein